MQSFNRAVARQPINGFSRIALVLPWFFASFCLVEAIASAKFGSVNTQVVVAAIATVCVSLAWTRVFHRRILQSSSITARSMSMRPRQSDTFSLVVALVICMTCVMMARHGTYKQWILGVLVFLSVAPVTVLVQNLFKRIPRIVTVRQTDSNREREDRKRRDADDGSGGVLAFLRPKPPVKSGSAARTFAEALERREY